MTIRQAFDNFFGDGDYAVTMLVVVLGGCVAIAAIQLIVRIIKSKRRKKNKRDS
jgi:hypothetical protein